jgi:hypothetical protein
VSLPSYRQSGKWRHTRLFPEALEIEGFDMQSLSLILPSPEFFRAAEERDAGRGMQLSGGAYYDSDGEPLDVAAVIV